MTTTDKPSPAAMDDMRDPDVASAMRAEESAAGATDKPSAGELAGQLWLAVPANATCSILRSQDSVNSYQRAGYSTYLLPSPPVAGAEVGVPVEWPEQAMSDELYCSWCNRTGHAPQPECRAGFPGQFPSAEEAIQRLRFAMAEAINLLTERTYGHPARSAGHNARLCLEAALALSTPVAERGGGE